MISITIYLDGKTSECGYKYVVQRDCMAWTAYRTDSGFRRFLALYGLKINPQFTQLHDMRAVGKGRVITTACYNKRVTDGRYFWSLTRCQKMRVGLSPSVMGNMLIAILRTTGRQPRFTAQTRTLKMYISRTTTGKWPIKSGKEGRTMNTYKVTFSNGDYLYTQLNASIEEAKAYYLGNIFNLGTEADNLQKCVDMEEVAQ